MFRELSATNTTPINLNLRRRRHQPHPEVAVQHHGQSGASSTNKAGDLDLSIHHPRGPHSKCAQTSRSIVVPADRPICNRFASLATPSPGMPQDRVHHTSGHNRQPRKSRGTREAKKRRDARRNRRNFAVQMLDDQLSRNIDQTLTMAKIHPTPAITAAPGPWKADVTFNWPSWTQIPPTPPQLPVLNLGSLDFKHFSLPSATKQRMPPTPPLSSPSVPLWCPYIPSLMHNGGWNGNVPRFTDLSSVAKRKETSKINSLVRWPFHKDSLPKKQSRFFPALTTSVSGPVTKPLPTGCRLYSSDQVLRDPQSTTWSDTFAQEVVPCIKSRQSGVVIAEDAPEMSLNEENSMQKNEVPVPNCARMASAANLWRILSEDGWLPNTSVRQDACQSSPRTLSRDDSEDSGGVAVGNDSVLPHELDSTAIPYVHLNSLVGHANEMGQFATATDDYMLSSAMYLAEFFAAPRASTPLCELPATPSLDTPSSPAVHTLRFTENSATVEQDVLTAHAHKGIATSDGHFKSEQDLFKPEEVVLPPTRAESPIDWATFLSQGHVEDCQCRDCSDAPVLVGRKELLEEEDLDWLDWSTVGDESEDTSITSTPQPAIVEDVSDEDERVYPRRHCPYASEWDGLFSQHSSEHGLGFDDGVTDDFLGYYDDGAAFARDADSDWVRMTS